MDVYEISAWLLMNVVWPAIQTALCGRVILWLGSIIWTVIYITAGGFVVRAVRIVGKAFDFLLNIKKKKTVLTVIVLAWIWITVLQYRKHVDNGHPARLSDRCGQNCSAMLLHKDVVNLVHHVPVELHFTDDSVHAAAVEYKQVGLSLFQSQRDIRVSITQVETSVEDWYQGKYSARISADGTQLQALKKQVENCEFLGSRFFGDNGVEEMLYRNISVSRGSCEEDLESQKKPFDIFRGIGWGTFGFPSHSKWKLESNLEKYRWAVRSMGRIEKAHHRLGGCLSDHVAGMEKDLDWMDRLAADRQGGDRISAVIDRVGEWAVKLVGDASDVAGSSRDERGGR